MSFFDELRWGPTPRQGMDARNRRPPVGALQLDDLSVEIKQGLKKPARVTRYEIADTKAVVGRKRRSRRIRHSVLNA